MCDRVPLQKHNYPGHDVIITSDFANMSGLWWKAFVILVNVKLVFSAEIGIQLNTVFCSRKLICKNFFIKKHQSSLKGCWGKIITTSWHDPDFRGARCFDVVSRDFCHKFFKIHNDAYDMPFDYWISNILSQSLKNVDSVLGMQTSLKLVYEIFPRTTPESGVLIIRMIYFASFDKRFHTVNNNYILHCTGNRPEPRKFLDMTVTYITKRLS